MPVPLAAKQSTLKRIRGLLPVLSGGRPGHRSAAPSLTDMHTACMGSVGAAGLVRTADATWAAAGEAVPEIARRDALSEVGRAVAAGVTPLGTATLAARDVPPRTSP